MVSGNTCHFTFSVQPGVVRDPLTNKKHKFNQTESFFRSEATPQVLFCLSLSFIPSIRLFFYFIIELFSLILSLAFLSSLSNSLFLLLTSTLTPSLLSIYLRERQIFNSPDRRHIWNYLEQIPKYQQLTDVQDQRREILK